MVITLDQEFPGADAQWLKGLEREFRWGVELEKAQYMARQKAARGEFESTPLKNVEGLGQLTHVFDARTYFRWLEEDPHFWEDDGNVKSFARDNPECVAPKPVSKTISMAR